MNHQDFQKLCRGDIVRHVSGANSYVVIDDNRKHPIGIRSVTLTNPDEWDKVPVSALEGTCEGCKQLGAAEEALKAMERRIKLLQNTETDIRIAWSEQVGRLSLTSLALIREKDQLRSELAAAQAQIKRSTSIAIKWNSELSTEENYSPDLEFKLSDLQAKVSELKGFLVDNKVHRDNPFIWSFVTDLFPDPKPEPEPQMWAWALEELREGRKVRWENWATKIWIERHGDAIIQSWNGCNFRPEMFYFTEPGWLPYED